MRRICLALAGILLLALPLAAAISPDEQLADPVLEERARDLGRELRCLVCQNQSIDDSDAELAGDLRDIVREKLEEGLSDQEIRDFMVERYGEFVLLKPPVNAQTWLLWAGPFLVLIIGAGAIVWFRHSGGPSVATQESADADLSAAEKAELAKLTGSSKGEPS